MSRDGQKLLEHLTESGDGFKPPSLVLLDLNMPRMDGREVLRRVRQLPALKAVPIVALTNSANPADVSGAYSEGANSCFRKPMDYSGLVRLVQLLMTYWLQAAQLPSDSELQQEPATLVVENMRSRL